MSASKRKAIGFAVLASLVLLWQILAWTNHAEVMPGLPMIPGWDVIFTSTYLGMADYWAGGFGIPTVTASGERTFAAATLALLSHSADTTARFLCGLLLGLLAGTLAGLSVSWSPWTRRLVSLPAQFFRTFPLLALIPLFLLWFGTSFRGAVFFIAFAVATVMFTGVVNAVENVQSIHIDNARTLGADRLRVYRTVVIPAMFPELRSTIFLALGIAWTAVIGAEFLGAQTGLGHIVVFSKIFAYVDRMFLVGILLLLYAAITFGLFNLVSRRFTAWMPDSAKSHM